MDIDIEKYIINHTTTEDSVLQELSRETHLKMLRPTMISGHLQGSFLTILVKIFRPIRILEIGTFTGYSAICMAKALSDDAILHTIDINDELEKFVLSYFRKANVYDKIKFHIGNAIDIIPNFDEKFDMVFIDAEKSEYIKYYELVFPKLSDNGIIIADNALWHNKVTDPIENNDDETKGIVAFNNLVQNDKRVENILLPIRDGLMLVRKKDI